MIIIVTLDTLLRDFRYLITWL